MKSITINAYFRQRCVYMWTKDRRAINMADGRAAALISLLLGLIPSLIASLQMNIALVNVRVDFMRRGVTS